MSNHDYSDVLVEPSPDGKWLAVQAMVDAQNMGVFLVPAAWRPGDSARRRTAYGRRRSAFILCFLAYSKVSIPLARDIGKVGGKSYGIYLMHTIFIEYSARLIYQLIPGVLAYPLFLVALLSVFGLGFPLLFMTVTERTPLRRWYSYLYD